MPSSTAKDILNRYWDGTIPVMPEKIAQAMGVRVSGRYHPHLSGEYIVDENGPEIFFNAGESPLRQRFTIAHELGHHALNHGPRFRDNAQQFSVTNYDSFEVAANQFAAELLAPSEAVHYLIGQGIAVSVESLAQQFKISTVSMEIRLKTLGYLSG